MTANAIFFVIALVELVVIAPLPHVKAMTIMDLPSGTRALNGLADPAEVNGLAILPIPLILERRSVFTASKVDTILKTDPRDNTRQVISRHQDRDDLETAAGTNVLRPLFVYRQQLAYRQRVRKAGRRAAPNF